jgi:hypothetical protein
MNQFMISGDTQGMIKVQKCDDLSVVLQGQVQQSMKPHNRSINSLTVLECPNQQPIVVAGDEGGFVTLVQQQQQVKSNTFGAYADSKNAD